MKKRNISLLLILFTLIAAAMLSSCEADLFGAKKCWNLELSTNKVTADISEEKIITITAKTFQKNGTQRSNTSMVWTFSPADSVSIVYKTADSIAFTVTAPGRIVLTAHDVSDPSIQKAVAITATGDLKSFLLSENKITMGQKEEREITVTFNPAEASNKELIWSSNDTQIAKATKVNENTAKIVSGIPGSTTITAKSAKNPSLTATCSVTVTEIEIPKTNPRYMTLSNSFMEFRENMHAKDITAKVYDGYNQEYSGHIEWTCSDYEIANLVPAGNTASIVPQKTGTCEITATLSSYPDIKATCKISVGNALSDIIITKYVPPVMTLQLMAMTEEPQFTGSIPIGTEAAYIASYLPESTSETGIIWTVSSDALSISPEEEIVTIKAERAGTANLIARSTKNPAIQSYATFSVYDPYVEPDNSIAKITLNPSSVTLERGHEEYIYANITMSDGTSGNTDILWTTDSSAVEIISNSSNSSSIRVKAKTPGLATITATARNNPFVSATTYVLVHEPGIEPGKDLQMLVPSSSSLTMMVGSTSKIDISYLPVDTQDKGLIWSSSDSCITVNGNSDSASITANSKGTSIITARSDKNPSISTSIRIKVLTPEEAGKVPAYLEITPSGFELEEGKTKDVEAIVHYTDGSTAIADVDWTTDANRLFLSYPSMGKTSVRAIQEGLVTLKASLKSNPGISAEISVLIFAEGTVPGQSLRMLIPSMSSLSMDVGESRTIDISYLPADTAERGLVWSSSNDCITINGASGSAIISAKTKGTSIITVRSESDPSITTSIKVSVIAKEEVSKIPSYLEITPSGFELEESQSGEVKAIVHFTDGSSSVADVDWSTNTEHLYLSTPSTGKAVIKAVKEGMVTLTATLKANPKINAEIAVYVYAKGSVPGQNLRMLVPSKSSISLIVGEHEDIDISYLPEGTSEKGIVWTTSGNFIQVDGNDSSARITALASGRGSVTATSKRNSGISTTINVDIKTPEEAGKIPSHITLSPSGFELEQNSSKEIEATVFYTDGTSGPADVSWNIDKKYLSLSTSSIGRASVTALTEGNTSIKATLKGYSGLTAEIAVNIYKEGTPPAEGLRMIIPSSTSITLLPGETTRIDISYLPEDTLQEGINWSTEGSCMTIDGTDHYVNITGSTPGTGTVHAISSSNPSVNAAIKVRVQTPEEAGKKPSYIEISPSGFEMKENSNRNIQAKVYFTDGTSGLADVKWTADSQYLNVFESSLGKATLTSVKAGTTKVKATLKSDSNISADISVLIHPEKSVAEKELKSLIPSSSAVTLMEGKSTTIDISYLPSDTMDIGLTWSTSSSSVSVTGNDRSATITAESRGSGIITATSTQKPEISTSIKVNVLSEEDNGKIPSYLVLNPSGFELEQNNSREITATVYYTDGSSGPANVNWSVNSRYLAISTSSLGKASVRGVNAGNTSIKATLKGHSDIFAEVSVLVYKEGSVPPAGLRMIIPSTTTLTMLPGEEADIDISYLPSDTAETGLTWTSAGNYVEVIGNDRSAKVKALNAGSGTIIARSTTNPDIYTSIKVKVQTPEEAGKIPNRIEITPMGFELEEHRGRNITATVYYTDGTSSLADVDWTVDNVHLSLTENSLGKATVSAGAIGKTTVKATLKSNKSLTSEIAVLVYAVGTDPSTALRMLIPSTTTVSILPGNEAKVDITYLPADTSDIGLTWSSAGNYVEVKGNDHGAVISGLNAGTGTVIARSSKNPDVFTSINVKVQTPEEAGKTATRIEIAPLGFELEEKASKNLTARVYYTDGTSSLADVDWTIDSQYLRITEPSLGKATVSALKSGTTTIKATLKGNSELASEITVLIYPEGSSPSSVLRMLVPSKTSLTMIKGDKSRIDISYSPADTTETGLIWSIAGNCITVDGNDNYATVTAKESGTATITVKSSIHPEIKTYIKVKVQTPEEAGKKPSYIEILPSGFELEETKTREVTVKVHYTDGTSGMADVNWNFDSTHIDLTETSMGKASIRALKTGNTKVSASLKSNSRISAELSIGIYKQGTDPSTVDLLQMVPSTTFVSLVEGTEMDVTLTYLPTETTTAKDVLWTTDRSSVATVSGTAGRATITANGPGTAVIIATNKEKPNVKTRINVRVIGVDEVGPMVSYVELFPRSVELYSGENQEIRATVHLVDGSVGNNKVTWSKDTDFIKITPRGNDLSITAVKPGISTVTAMVKDNPDATASLKVLVFDDNNDPGVSLKVIIPSSSSFSLQQGKKASVTLDYLPSATSEKGVTWSSKNQGIATVSPTASGAEITATGIGSTSIIATSKVNPDISTTIRVTVLPEDYVPRKVNVINLSNTAITIDPPYSVGAQGITATSEDMAGNRIEDQYIWTLDSTGIISGYENPSDRNQYLISAVGPGVTKLTVKSKNNPAITASCKITVNGGLNSIKLSPDTLKLAREGSASVTAEFSPVDTTETDITWSVIGDGVTFQRDPQNRNRVFVTGKKPGTATLKATSTKNPKISGSCKITILDEFVPEDTVPNSIVLSTDVITINPPITKPSILTAKVYGKDGTIYPRGVKWSIEDPSIAELSTQDEERVAIIAHKAGETRIIARSVIDETVTASCILTVSGKINSISPEQTYISIVVGTSQEIKVSLNPTNTIETELVWTSEDQPKAPGEEGEEQKEQLISLRPTASGCLVSGLKQGETTITVSSKIRPEVKANIAVKVIDPPKVMATITLNPSVIELTPDSRRTKITAKVQTDTDTTINEEVIFTIDPPGLVNTTAGGSNEIYLIPNGIAGEGTIYASLPSYPHIEAAKARLFVGGQLRSLVAKGSQSVAVNVGETIQVGIGYNPENTTETGIIWSSSNSQVARVNGGNSTDAIITGISSGVATITARSTHYNNLKVEFTVVVKSIINEVSFTDQNGNKGMIFSTNTDDDLTLACKLSPDIEKKIVYKLKTTNFSLATITPVAGTVNDITFTPDPSAAGLYEFDLISDNRPVGVLSIYVTFDGVTINTTREVFEDGYKECQLEVTSTSGQISPEMIKWKSSDTMVAEVDKNGKVRAISPGEARITANISGGMELVTQVYVNVNLPDSFETALRQCGYLPYNGDTVLPSQLERITTLDLRNTSKSMAVDLSELRKLPNLTELIIDGISLTNSTLSLSNCNKLKTVRASNCEITGFSGVPKTLEYVSARNNIITSYAPLSNGNIKYLDLSSNKIASYIDLALAEDVNLSSNMLKRITSTSTKLLRLNVSNNQIADVNINCRALKYLNLNNNLLRYDNFTLEDKKDIIADNLQELYLANNMIGIYKNRTWPEAGAVPSPNETNYWESESMNKNQPLQTIYIDDFPSLRILDLRNNHIRSGLSAYDKSFIFQIAAKPLERVYLEGNNIGNYYRFYNRNCWSNGISSLSSSGTTNRSGMTISYDGSGCFYTYRVWHESGALWWYKTWYTYHSSRAYMY